ncbi:MAG: hypothetical protein K2K56_14770 [Lachnospiraceae bacterium]|nr:hypothetical protein [Lachnospiraceae bacterium]
MTEVLEIIFELLIDFIVEGSLEIGTSKRGPMIVRIIAGLVFGVIYGGFTVMLFIFGIQALRKCHTVAGCLFILVAAGLAALCIYLFAKKYRENRRRKQPEEKSDKC